MGFWWTEWRCDKFFSEFFDFPLTMLPNYVHLHAALTRRTSGRSLGTFKQNSAPSDIGEQWKEKYFKVCSTFTG